MGVAYFKRFVCVLSIPYIPQKIVNKPRDWTALPSNPPKQWITLLKKLIAGRGL
jgi:hypothetical protein